MEYFKTKINKRIYFPTESKTTKLRRNLKKEV